MRRLGVSVYSAAAVDALCLRGTFNPETLPNVDLLLRRSYRRILYDRKAYNYRTTLLLWYM